MKRTDSFESVLSLVRALSDNISNVLLPIKLRQ